MTDVQTDKHGKPLRGAALRQRLKAEERRELEGYLSMFLERQSPEDWKDWVSLPPEERVPTLVAIDDLMRDYATNGAISIQEIGPSNLSSNNLQDFISHFPVLAVAAKMIGYTLAFTGASMLVVLLANGGSVKEATDAGFKLGSGVAVLAVIKPTKQGQEE